MKEKIIVVCGPTATGKSDYAVALAKKIGGEIISADSRQVYRELDIGSGKITKKEMKGVPHHLLDVASPSRVFSVAHYQKRATRAIKDILKRGKTPIICGGTGFYIDAIVYDQVFPGIKPNPKLRAKLSKDSLGSLQTQLLTLDPERYESVDTKNKVRLIRAIEIALALGSVPKIEKKPLYEVEWICLDFPDEVLKQRIHDRLIKRLRAGMVAEIKSLRESGMSWRRLEMLGLEYREVARFLQGKTTKTEMIETLERDIWHYAKRQRTWFKKYAK